MGQQAREPLGERGRSADVPNDIPKRGWQDIAWRVVRAARRDRVTMFAAGVAFYALLALFPTIAAVISVWGLLFDPVEAGRQLYAEVPGGLRDRGDGGPVARHDHERRADRDSGADVC